MWPSCLMTNMLVVLMPRMAEIQTHYQLTSCPKNALLAQKQGEYRPCCLIIHENQVSLFPLPE